MFCYDRYIFKITDKGKIRIQFIQIDKCDVCNTHTALHSVVLGLYVIYVARKTGFWLLCCYSLSSTYDFVSLHESVVAPAVDAPCVFGSYIGPKVNI